MRRVVTVVRFGTENIPGPKRGEEKWKRESILAAFRVMQGDYYRSVVEAGSLAYELQVFTFPLDWPWPGTIHNVVGVRQPEIVDIHDWTLWSPPVLAYLKTYCEGKGSHLVSWQREGEDIKPLALAPRHVNPRDFG